MQLFQGQRTGFLNFFELRKACASALVGRPVTLSPLAQTQMDGHAAKENTHAAQPRPVAGSSSSIINLNVGGHIFATSAETLQAGGESFFTSLIGDKFKAERDQNDNIFIDRDREPAAPSPPQPCVHVPPPNQHPRQRDVAC